MTRVSWVRIITFGGALRSVVEDRSLCEGAEMIHADDQCWLGGGLKPVQAAGQEEGCFRAHYPVRAAVRDLVRPKYIAG